MGPSNKVQVPNIDQEWTSQEVVIYVNVEPKRKKGHDFEKDRSRNSWLTHELKVKLRQRRKQRNMKKLGKGNKRKSVS